MLVGRVRARFTLRQGLPYVSQSGLPTAVESSLHVWMLMQPVQLDDIDQARVIEVAFVSMLRLSDAT